MMAVAEMIKSAWGDDVAAAAEGDNATAFDDCSKDR